MIPEFTNNCSKKDYLNRIDNNGFLILIAVVDKRIVGFKIGYDRYKDGSFYSWLGGVVPNYRKKRIATKLTKLFEEWSASEGYTKIIIKTRIKFKAMINLLLKEGYSLKQLISKTECENTRLIFEKKLV